MFITSSGKFLSKQVESNNYFSSNFSLIYCIKHISLSTMHFNTLFQTIILSVGF